MPGEGIEAFAIRRLISILRKLSDKDLLECYNMAIEHKIEKAFIALLERELVRRGISVQPWQ
jgi:hypothetical protein